MSDLFSWLLFVKFRQISPIEELVFCKAGSGYLRIKKSKYRVSETVSSAEFSLTETLLLARSVLLAIFSGKHEST